MPHPLRFRRKGICTFEYLLRHPKHVVTKDQIIAHVWNYDADVLPNTVEVTIKNLRTKLEKTISQQRINHKNSARIWVYIRIICLQKHDRVLHFGIYSLS